MDCGNDSITSASSFPGGYPGDLFYLVCVTVVCSVEVFMYACYLMFSCFSVYVRRSVYIYQDQTVQTKCITNYARCRCQLRGPGTSSVSELENPRLAIMRLLDRVGIFINVILAVLFLG